MDWVSKLHLALYRKLSEHGLAKAKAVFLPCSGAICTSSACVHLQQGKDAGLRECVQTHDPSPPALSAQDSCICKCL